MEREISYKLRRSKRAKRMRLAVYLDGTVVVTSPFWLKESIIEKFLAEKREWVLDKIQFFKSVDRKAIRTFSRRDYVENKGKALALVRDRVKFYNTFYGFSFNKIFIKNQKTRWGSCSSRKNLNFNYKIVFLPKEHQDYVVVHELCHLKEFNHSRKFWALIEKAIPNYVNIKKELPVIFF